MIGTLGDDTVMGKGDDTPGGVAIMGPDNGTLGADGVVGAISGIYVASIFCKVLMAFNFSALI